MGAWGHGSFDNDSAMDWVSELTDGESGLADPLETVTSAEVDAYFEVDECSAVLAAAELVAAAHGKGDERLDEDASAWLNENRASASRVDAQLARRAVERVFGASELRELWDENGPDTEWHQGVRELLRRLT
jgi:hypothetical protein